MISVIVHVPALLTHPPSHLQRTVQCTVALEHLQFPVQDTSQPQRNRTEQALLLSSRVVQNGSHSPVLVFCQPQSWKSGVSSWTEVACLQKKQVCSSALRMCWYRAACVGGKSSNFFFPLVNSLCLASLTLSSPQLLLYMTTTKRSSLRMCWDSRLSSCGSLVRATSVSVIPVVFGQAGQAVFFPHPNNCETVSQPVTAWNSGRALHLDGPSCADRVWMGMSRVFFPLPRQIHNSERPNEAKKWIARITTSLSTVRTKATLWPCCKAWARCSIILVSASLWLQGWRPDMLWRLLERTTE